MSIKWCCGKQPAQAPAIGKIDMGFLTPVNTSFCLEKICESNYQKLFRLIPDLQSFASSAIGFTSNRPPLYLDVLERNPYTLTICLSHCFEQQLDELLEPAVKIRVYLDVQLAEVIRDHVRADVSSVYKDPGAIKEIQDYKWRLNYFLQKWLDHCLHIGYQFEITV